jgi:hypothetical protein
VRVAAIAHTVATVLVIMTGVSGAAESTTCLSESLAATVLQDAAVQDYLHPEMPGRNPLLVAGLGLVNGTRLDAGKVRAVVVEWKRAGESQVFRFNRCSVSDGKGAVEFQFRAEGLEGSMSLHRGLEGWLVEKRRLVEQ